MSRDDQADPSPEAARSRRDARLGQALRENLQRRKAQQRGRGAASTPAAEAGAAPAAEAAEASPAGERSEGR